MMKDKYIRSITLLGLVATLALQAVWLLNTYHLTNEELQRHLDDLFQDAMTSEMFYRIEQIKAKNGNPQKETYISASFGGLDESDLASGTGLAFINGVQAALQEVLETELDSPISLERLDSFYVAGLDTMGIRAKLVCHIVDSLGTTILASSRPEQVGSFGIKTNLHPINEAKSRNLQAEVLNPFVLILGRMSLLLIATAVMMLFVAYCIVYQIRIITRQNKIAKLREDFSYAMIHDMKTPLTSILMGAQILRTGKLDAQPEKREKYFQILKDEGEHLLSLTNKVLTLSKLENHQLKLAKEDVALRPLLEDLTEKYIAKAAKPVRFTLQLAAETVYADEEFLKEALSNLIDNSIKYSGAEVDILLSSVCTPEGIYIIKVKDNGLGIPLKDQSRIFEKYERAAAATRSRNGGASGFGLGLNYVLRVAEAHGGTVEVESIEGEYSEFSIFLPARPDETRKE